MRRRNWPLIFVASLCVIGAVSYLVLSRDVLREPARTLLRQVLQAVPTPTPVPPPVNPTSFAVVPTALVPEVTIPPVSQSPPPVTDLVPALSSHPQFRTWAETEGHFRRFVVGVANIAEGLSPSTQVPFLKPAAKFRTSKQGERLLVDPKSYERYDLVADVVASLNPQACAAAYRKAKPLLSAEYRELGTPHRDFDDVLTQAIAQLLATPVVDGDIEVQPLVITYAFADPTLESLSPVQRQLLRMGPRNMRLIQAQLRAIARALGLEIPAGGDE